MLCLTKKTEYALAALAYLSAKPGQTASAREIAAIESLPLALLMNILKNLQGHGLLQSTRGVKGGYRLGRKLEGISLHELIATVECRGRSMEQECGCLEQSGTPTLSQEFARPVQSLQVKLENFLRGIRVADLVPSKSEQKPSRQENEHVHCVE
jgi:Rrf2 family protein